MVMDLSSFSSIKKFSEEFLGRFVGFVVVVVVGFVGVGFVVVVVGFVVGVVVSVMVMDLGSFASIKKFSEEFLERFVGFVVVGGVVVGVVVVSVVVEFFC